MHTHTGWDWPIEYLNLLIRNGVDSNITWELIEKFIRRVNFTGVVNRGLDAIFRANRHLEEATDKDLTSAVDMIKEFLHEKLGTTWAEVTIASDANQLELDLASWGGTRYARREAPWEQVARERAGMEQYVRDEIVKMCKWHNWAP